MVQHAHCDEVCTQSNRQFPDGTPLILIVNVEFLAASGALASESDPPSISSFLGEGIDTTYLFSIFICSLNIPKFYENS